MHKPMAQMLQGAATEYSTEDLCLFGFRHTGQRDLDLIVLDGNFRDFSRTISQPRPLHQAFFIALLKHSFVPGKIGSQGNEEFPRGERSKNFS